MTLTDYDLVAIGRIIRTEAFNARPPDPVQPPPYSADSERMLVGAVLAGHVRASDLDVEPNEFFQPLHRSIWGMARKIENAGKVVTAPALLAALAAQGVVGQTSDTVAAIAASAEKWPVSIPDLREEAEVVIEMAARRRLIDTLTNLCVKLSLGTVGTETALERLSEAVEGIGV